MARYIDQPDSYLNVALKVVHYVALAYPQATLWLTGHSLGGAVAALAAAEIGTSAVLFATPGDYLFAIRAGYEFEEGADLPLFHFGSSGDPIFMGKCRGITSACYLGGYALETKCHTGTTCLFDENVAMDIRNHRMAEIIAKIQSIPEFRPKCSRQMEDCTDCEEWSTFPLLKQETMFIQKK
jgi:lipase ATG15